MSKEIICVYQDCIMCGDRGKQIKKIILNNNLNVRKVSFASDEGKNLIHEAVFKHNIGSMPFFTDGNIYTYHIEDFLVKPEKEVVKIVKPTKKAKKTKKGGVNEINR